MTTKHRLTAVAPRPLLARRGCAATLGAAVLLVSAGGPAWAAGASNANTILLANDLASKSVWYQAVTALGFTVERANNAQWAQKTQADFRTYRAIVIPDRNCAGPSGDPLTKRATWSPAITGNVLVVGGDLDYHCGSVTYSPTGAVVSQTGSAPCNTVVYNGLKFVADDWDYPRNMPKTGLFVSMGCSYSPIMDQFGISASSAIASATDNVRIVAIHPALSGLTDAMLSNWGTSTHLGFVSWPAGFTPLANQTLGSRSSAYLLAKGIGVQPVGLNISVAVQQSAMAGTNVTYTLTYANSGGTAAAGVNLAATLPAGTTFVSASNGGTLSAGTLKWSIGSLAARAAKQSVTVTLKTATAGLLTFAGPVITATGVAAVTAPAAYTTVIK